MSMLLLGLVLKIAMTASIVVAASIVVERSGPFIGSLIASLPTAGGAALIILAMEHSPDFIAKAAIGSVVSNGIVAIFALSYAAAAQRHSLTVSLGFAFLIWFICVALSRLVDWNVASAVLFNVVVYPLTILAGGRFRSEGAARRVETTTSDLVWRAVVVTVCVIVVTAASNSIGSYLSGIFVFFPVAMASFFVILHPRIGGPAAANVAAHVQAPLIGLGLGVLAVHYLAEPIGVWWSYLVGLSIGLAWNALLWAGRDWRKKK